MPAATGAKRAQPALAATAGGVLSDLVQRQLQEEWDRRRSLEQRGITIITTAGALVTLLIAVAGSGRFAALHALPLWTKVVLGLPLPFFAAAALLGLATNWESPDVVADEAGLKDLLTPDLWGLPASGAALKVARMYTSVLESVRRSNRTKGELLRMAIVAEAVAVSCLAVGVGISIWTA